MIKISLPNPNDYDKDIKHFLRQMELTVHHAQKAWEEIEKEAKEHPEEWADNWKENFYVTFRFPEIDLYERDQDEQGRVKVHVDEESSGMQEVVLEIANA